MNIEYLFVGVLVAAAVGYLARVWTASLRSESGQCSGGCGCRSSLKPGEDRLGRRREVVQLGVKASDRDSGDSAVDSGV